MIGRVPLLRLVMLGCKSPPCRGSLPKHPHCLRLLPSKQCCLSFSAATFVTITEADTMAMSSVHWGAVLLGYVVGSFFSLFQLWAWAKGLMGGKARTGPAA